MLLLTIKIVATYLVSVAPTPLWSFALRIGGIKSCLFCNDMRIYLQLLLFATYVANPFIFMRLTCKKNNKKIKRKIVAPENQIRRRHNGNQVASVILPPFLVIPRHIHEDSTFLGDVHRFNKMRSRRVAPIPREKRKNNKERTANTQIEYANR